MSAPGFFHDCLSEFGRILDLAGLQMTLHTGLLDVPSRKPGLRQWQILRKHWLCVRQIKKTSPAGQGHLLREFSTIPLWICLVCLRLPANRLTLLVNHNLQWALTRRLNRLAFRDLQKRGARLWFFEFVPEAALQKIGMNLDGCVALPIPVKDRNSIQVTAEFDVGLIGRWTAANAAAVREILSDGGVTRLLIAAPNIREAVRDLAVWADRLTFRDTTAPADFDRAIQSCRMIYFPYPEALYYYRVSGLLTDAVRNRVPVLVPDYPMLRHQVETPVRIGQVYERGEEFSRARVRVCGTEYDFGAYAAGRSADAVAARLKQLTGGGA